MTCRFCLTLFLITSLLSSVVWADSAPAPAATPAAAPATPAPIAAGHSEHGETFDEGPRQKAYLMTGMPKIQFAVTTTNAEAQAFFNQGVGQLHGFWYFEAERSFRQAAVLDPNLAMSYWGMARANINNEKRARGFIKLAVERKATASPREQLWIDSLAEYYKEPPQPDKERRQALIKATENIVQQYPDDIEAKAYLALQIWESRGPLPISSHQAVDALIQQIFAVDPVHPAHHFQIHLWNREKDARALASAAQCGQSAPGIAHMWHMPGHTYTELKRYDDAAWQQEASARVDHAHMMRDRVMPDQIHNYAHNNEWLAQNLSYVGRVREAIDLAKNMVELPRRNAGTSSYSMGRAKLFEILTAFELWDELIALSATPYLEPTEHTEEQAKRLRALGVAWFSKGEPARGNEQLAELEKLQQALRLERVQAADAAEAKATAEKKPANEVSKAMADALQSFNDRIKAVDAAIAELKSYSALAAKDFDAFRKQREQGPEIAKERLSQLFAQVGDAEKALQLAKEACEGDQGQILPLANYVDLLVKFGKQDEAKQQFAKLREMSAAIDMDLPVIGRLAPLAQELQLPADWRVTAATRDDVGVRPDLNSLGPFRWSPSPAADWSLADMHGQSHSLGDFDGKPVIVIFYLGAGCPHCIEQLNAIAPVVAEFDALGISLIAISTDSTAGLKDTFAQSKTDGTFPFPIVSDESLASFKAYRAFDDFENQPLHGVFLLDGEHRVRWQDISYQPYTDTKFLLKEAKRLLELSTVPAR
jgi:peroxiredoxin